MGQLGFGIVILPKSGKAECEALALLSYHKGQRGLVDRQVNKYGQQSGQYLLQFINFYFVDQSCSSRELAALFAGPLKCHQRLAQEMVPKMALWCMKTKTSTCGLPRL